MPRPMLKQQQAQTQNNSILSATQQESKQQTQQMSKMEMDRLLRQPRSKEYMEAMHSLDAGGHVHNQAQVDQIIQVIQNEFPEIQIQGVLLGFVSICYLGHPYEVHTLDMTGQIIQHYKGGQGLPGGMEKARSIAIRGGYDFIEVYAECCRCISSTGAVAVVNT